MQPAKRPRRVLGYARVSSVAQTQGTSLADQQASIAAYAKGRGLKVDRFFVEAESGIGVKGENREQMMALMDAVRDGDLVVCDKLDRWSRDPIHTLTSVRDILAKGASFFVVSDSLDPATRDGGLMLHMRAAIAQEEHARIRERTIGTRIKIRDDGYWVEGEVPFGYRRPAGEKGLAKNVLVEHEVQGPKVRDFFRLSVKGYSLKAIVAETGETKEVVHRALRNRHYLGEMTDSRGVTIRGRHPALVTAAVFEKSLAKLRARKHGARPSGTPSRTSTWIIRDVAHCLVCGRRMTAAYGGDTRWPRDYYMCRARAEKTCVARLVRREDVEPLFSQLVAERLVSMAKELSTSRATKAAPVVDHTAKVLKLERKRARTVEAFTDGAMSRQDMRAAVARIDAELNSVREASEPVKVITREMRLEMLAEVEAIHRAWATCIPKEQRAIVNMLANKALIEREKGPVPEWKPLDEVLDKAA